jgi:hypothetical protein
MGMTSVFGRRHVCALGIGGSGPEFLLPDNLAVCTTLNNASISLEATRNYSLPTAGQSTRLGFRVMAVEEELVNDTRRPIGSQQQNIYLYTG